MATLERIRRRSGLLIIVIGLAMAAFILTDLLGSGNSLFNDYNSIGSVDGEKIARTKFSQRMEEIKNSNPQYANLSQKQLADFAWNMILRDELMGSEYEELGMSITPDELHYDIINNPQIQQNFSNPQTGQFDENAFNQTLSQIKSQSTTNPEAAEQWASWLQFEKGVKEQSLTFKYNAAVEKGLYTPKALAQKEYIANSQNYNTEMVIIPFSTIADSTVEVSESEKSSYYNAHKEDYKQEAVRNIEYVSYAIQPSAADKKAVTDELNGLMNDRVEFNAQTSTNDTIVGFANTTDDSTFVMQHSDQPFDAAYHVEGELPANIDSLMHNAEVGFTFGPYEEGTGYKLSKLSGIKMVPDSAKARHILIAYQGAERAGENVTRAPQEAQMLADSLYKVIKDDVSQFDTISAQYNDDAVAKTKGGDLGYFSQGQMAQPFNDYVFLNKTGDIGLVYTNFGIHIIEITDQQGSNKAVRVASIYREVLASEQTINDIYSEASQFASEAQRSEDYRALAEEKGLQLRPAVDIKQFDDNIIGLGSSRKIVQWAWNDERSEGDVGLIDNNNQNYVVVILTDIFEEGYTPMDKIDEELTQKVRNQKKGEMLMQKLAEAKSANSDLQSIAAALNASKRNQLVNRNTNAITGAGNEPKLVGAIVASEAGKVSEPIAGESLAMIFQVMNIDEAFAKPEYNQELTAMNRELRNRVSGQLFEALKSSVDIEDNRAMFY